MGRVAKFEQAECKTRTGIRQFKDAGSEEANHWRETTVHIEIQWLIGKGRFHRQPIDKRKIPPTESKAVYLNKRQR